MHWYQNQEYYFSVLKMILSFLSVLFCCAAVWAGPYAPRYDLSLADQLFEEFVKTHQRQYGSEQERQMRFSIFKDNLKTINKQNLESKTAVFGMLHSKLYYQIQNKTLRLLNFFINTVHYRHHKIFGFDTWGVSPKTNRIKISRRVSRPLQIYARGHIRFPRVVRLARPQRSDESEGPGCLWILLGIQRYRYL